MRIAVAAHAVVSDAELKSLGLVPVYRRGTAVWAAYSKDRTLGAFGRQLAAYENATKKLAAIAKIETIAPWSRADRMGPRLAAIEIEPSKEYSIDLLLMPLDDEQQNPQAPKAIEEFVRESGGRIVDRALEKTFSVMRARLGGQALNELLDYRSDVALVELPPRVEVTVPAAYSLGVDDLSDVDAPPEAAPVVCIVDSGIVEGQPLLAPAIIGAKSRSFPASLGPPIPRPPVGDAGHGTRVAGIALYGDVARCVVARSFVPELRLINARLLDDKNELDPERMPLMREIVDHVKDTCRIVNLSLGLEPNEGFLSVHAVELDTITRDTGVLFIVSSGNVSLKERYRGKLPTKKYPDYLLDAGWTVRAPGEALNVLTVGGITPDGDLFRPNASRVAVAPKRAPAPFCCSGGLKNVVKPELVEVAGNVAWDSTGPHWVTNDAGLGVATTNHDFIAGKLFCFEQGSSFSTPKVAHLAARIVARYPEASPNLVRALLIQSARWPDGTAELSTKQKMRLIGFGVPDLDRALYCRPQRVSLYYEGAIRPDEVQIFEVPVPLEVARAKGRKKITVTVAYDPPVSAVQRDRPAGVQLSWGLASGDVSEAALRTAIAAEAEVEASQESTSKRRKSPFMKCDLPKRDQERGTVQKNEFGWTRGSHGETYRLAITAKAIRPAHTRSLQSFAVVVGLECADDAINVFNLVRTKLSAGRVRIRVPGS